MENILVYISSFGFIPITFLFLLSFVKGLEGVKEKPYNLFCLYLVIIALIQTTGTIIAMTGNYNLHLSHYYFIGEFIALSIFFRELLTLKQRRFVNVLISIVILILAVLVVLNIIGIRELKPFDPLEIVICALPLLIFAVMHLYNSMSTSLRFIYVSIGVIFYKTLSVVIFMLLNFANTEKYFKGLSDLLWNLNRVFLIVYFIIILFEWFKNYKFKKVK